MMKEHLGDGVYVQIDNGGLVLTAENGVSITAGPIYLDLQILKNLKQYVERVSAKPPL